MAQVLIHFGPHKTGTSALQKFFFNNRDWLKSRGIVYDLMGDSWYNHHPLAVSFRSPEHYAKGRDFINKTIDANPDSTILFSSEMFCEADIDRHEFLKCFNGLNFRAIGYLRNPCSLLASAYNEVVRDPKVRRTVAICDRPLPYDPSMASILHDWIDCGKLALFPYDPVQWKGGSIFSDFLCSVGVDIDDAVIPEKRENESLPFELVEAIRAANIAGVDGKEREKFIDILREINLPRRTFPMSVEQCEDCIDQFRRVAETYRPYFRGDFDEDYLFVNPAAA